MAQVDPAWEAAALANVMHQHPEGQATLPLLDVPFLAQALQDSGADVSEDDDESDAPDPGLAAGMPPGPSASADPYDAPIYDLTKDDTPRPERGGGTGVAYGTSGGT